MEKFCFDVPVDRSGIGNMKGMMADTLPNKEQILILAGAEMDFPTAPVICQAISEFAQKGIYGFTLPDETYRESIVNWMKKVRNISVQAEDIVPTLGTIMALNTAIRAFTDTGDGVIIQHPSYYRHDSAVQNNGRNIVVNHLKERDGVYQIDFQSLEKQFADEKNKMMILCNPQNPTGKVFSKEELKQIADLAEKYDMIIFSDEIFAEITYGDHTAVPYASIDETHSLLCTSLGKVYNFTGVNHANVIIKNEELRERYLKQRKIDHFGSIDPFFYTALTAGYSEEGYQWIQQMKAQVWKNYLQIKNTLGKYMPEIVTSPLEGGFTLWIDFRKLKLNAAELKKFLEQDAMILGDSGEEYGSAGSGFFRFNIAITEKMVETFLTRLHLVYQKRFVK